MRAFEDEASMMGDVMVMAFRAACENAALRRLVLSMALALADDEMPADERALLTEITSRR